MDNKKQEYLETQKEYFENWGIESIKDFIELLKSERERGFDSNWCNKKIKIFEKAKEALETNNIELFETIDVESLWLDCHLSYLRDISVKSYAIE